MKAIYTLILFVIAAFVATTTACKTSSKTATAATNTTQDTITDLNPRKVIKDRELFAATTDALQLDSAYLENNILHVLTKKINACDAANFKMFWNGMMAKSYPPQTSLKLFLLSDPTCKEMHHFHLTFDVKTLQFKEDSVIRTDTVYNKATIIKLGGLKQPLKYNF